MASECRGLSGHSSPPTKTSTSIFSHPLPLIPPLIRRSRGLSGKTGAPTTILLSSEILRVPLRPLNRLDGLHYDRIGHSAARRGGVAIHHLVIVVDDRSLFSRIKSLLCIFQGCGRANLFGARLAGGRRAERQAADANCVRNKAPTVVYLKTVHLLCRALIGA